MNSYSFDIRDYIAHTAHLDPIEDIAYRRLLDLYHLTEEPLRGRPEQIARRIGLRDRIGVVNQILHEFFEEDTEVGDNPTPIWRHHSADQFIATWRSV